jgi:hypothetical protein
VSIKTRGGIYRGRRRRGRRRRRRRRKMEGLETWGG